MSPKKKKKKRSIYQREIKVYVDKRLVNVHGGIIHNRYKVGTRRTV